MITINGVKIEDIKNKEDADFSNRHDKELIQRFHDYQVDWLKSHHDIELEPQLEELILHFLHDTANCFILEDNV